MPLRITWQQALAWRMHRQLLDPVGRLPVEGVVRRLCGIQAQVASSAELAISVRRQGGKPADVGRALADGRLIKTWAMRGALHLVTPEDGGAFLSLIAAGRAWERPSWQRYFGMTPNHWDELRAVVREALDGGPLTREEVAMAVGRRASLAHIEEALRGGWGTLLKPLAWRGDLCFVAVDGNRATFARPDLTSSRWAGVPDPDEAAPPAIRAYVGTYGPTTAHTFANWLVAGWSSKRQLKRWFAEAAEHLAEVEIDGEPRFVLAEDLDALASTTARDTVRLLPGFDQYVLGPTTEDRHVLPARRRAAVSRQAGWISPVVVAGGVVSGTWQRDGDVVRITWFRDAGTVPTNALDEEVARLGSILDRPLRPVVRVTRQANRLPSRLASALNNDRTGSAGTDDPDEEREAVRRAGPPRPELIDPDPAPNETQGDHCDHDVIDGSKDRDEFRDQVERAHDPGEEADQDETYVERGSPVANERAQ